MNDRILQTTQGKGEEKGKILGLSSALVLSGEDLIFFTVATMGLCFGAVLRAVLVILGNSSIPKAFYLLDDPTTLLPSAVLF